MELIATAAEQGAGYRPEVRQVRRVLTEIRAECFPWPKAKRGLRAPVVEVLAGGPPRSPFYRRRSPYPPGPTCWSRSAAYAPAAPEDFEKLLEIRGG